MQNIAIDGDYFTNAENASARRCKVKKNNKNIDKNKGIAAENAGTPEESNVHDIGETELTSASARILAATEGDTSHEPEAAIAKGSAVANFWYHYKWPTIIISFFVIVIIIAVAQMAGKEKEDVSIMYAGPQYISSEAYDSLRDAMKNIMSDYNGDGEKGIMFSSLTCMTDTQIEWKYQQAKESGIADFYIDKSANLSELKRFEVNLMVGEHVIMFMDPALYKQASEVCEFVPLAEIFDDVPDCAMDEYAVRIAATEFYDFFDGVQIIPDDTLIVVRRVSSMTAYRKAKDADALQQYHNDMIRDLVEFSLDD